MLMTILAIIPTLNDDPTKTVESILMQSVEVSKIIVGIGSKTLYAKLLSHGLERTEYVYVKPDFRQPLGIRVGAAINTVLSKENLKKYDYILKVDAEVTLPKNFVEENLREKPDFIASGGTAMVFKTYPFLEMGGKYPETPELDDTYLSLQFLSKGYTVKRWVCPPEIKARKKGHHNSRHHIRVGIEWYKLGYEPIHVLYALQPMAQGILKGKLMMELFLRVSWYFLAVLKRIERYEFAPWVFMMQVRRLIYGRQFKY